MNSSGTYLVELEAPPALVQKDDRRADEVRKRVQELDTKLTLNQFELGDLLAEVKANNYWNDWKFESFNQYLKKSGIDISPRQSDYLIMFSNVSKKLGISKTALAKAKNSKLKEIFTLDPLVDHTDEATQVTENMGDIMKKLVDDAPHKTLEEVKEIVKRLKGNNEEDADVSGELTWMNMPVRRDAKQIVLQAIELASALSGGTLDTMTKEVKDLSMAASLERICADFMADPNNVVSDELGTEGVHSDSVEEVDEDSEEEEEYEDDDSI